MADRGLAKVDRRRESWTATITDIGTHYLQHNAYPGDPDRGSAAKPERHRMIPSEPRKPPAPKPVAKSDQLVADVIAAGGRLEVQSDRSGQPNYSVLVQHAIRRGVVPEGKLLKEQRGGGWGKSVITLTDAPAWMTAKLEPVSIAETLRKPHPAVARLRSDRDERLRVRSAVRSRALLLLDAVAKAAELQGFSVTVTRAAQAYEPRYQRDDSLLTFSKLTHDFGLGIDEVYKKVPHEPTPAELRRAERDSWFRIPKNKEVPSGKLKLTIGSGVPYRQSSWTDAGEEATELFLAEIVQELGLRTAHAEEQRLAREREEQERQRQWEAAMGRAKEQLQESHRAGVLTEQLDRWRKARQLNQYLAALTETVSAMPDGEERDSAERWVRWASEYASGLDPLKSPIAMPADIVPTHDNLKPFMGGWSTYGPRGY